MFGLLSLRAIRQMKEIWGKQERKESKYLYFQKTGLPHPKFWWDMPIIILSSYLQAIVQFAGLLADARDTKSTPTQSKEHSQ